ncbi:zinc finger protein [Capsicum chacoense]
MAMEFETQRELGFPFWKPIRRRFGPDDPFFAYGNIQRELLAKQIALDLTEEEKQLVQNIITDEEISNLFCPIIGCGAQMKSLDDFEDHYATRHTASCSVCSRVYPTSRLLSIHVSEAHDSFFQAKAAHGFPMYECLVEGCGVKLKSYKSRQQHLVDKHKFSASYEFFRKARPSKKQRQKSQYKQASNKTQAQETSSAMQVEEERIDNLVSAVSKLTTADSPSAISFGRSRTRGLSFVPRAVNRQRGSVTSTGGTKK